VAFEPRRGPVVSQRLGQSRDLAEAHNRALLSIELDWSALSTVRHFGADRCYRHSQRIADSSHHRTALTMAARGEAHR
jgi:hypothetical protein